MATIQRNLAELIEDRRSRRKYLDSVELQRESLA